jgi:uncharacterized protein with von Willebrand factor type A (vWA) domain
MFQYTVTYKDFNDVEHVEKLHFHIMVPEIADLEFNPVFDGSMGDYVRQAMASGEGQKIYTFFKMLIVNSYGRRSEDGAKFLKREEFTEDFLNSPAYEKFFEWLTLDSPDGKNAEKFWAGIMPERIIKEADAVEKEAAAAGKKDITQMTREELVEAMQKRVSDKEITV